MLIGAFSLNALRTQAQDAPADGPVQSAVAQEALAVAKLITYQGRLLNPATGVAKLDGTYAMTFRIYNHPVNVGANLLWTEEQDVVTANGIFGVLLGSVIALPASLFNGQNLWLGVTVGTDSEMAPRTRMTTVAYALYAENAATAALATNATNAANASLIDGIDSTTLATEAEVLPLVKADDGAGSGIDADLLDGMDSAAFAKRQITPGTATTWNCGDLHFFQSFPVPPSTLVLYRIDSLTAGGYFKLDVTSREVAGNVIYEGTVVNTSGCPGGPFNYKITRFDLTN